MDATNRKTLALVLLALLSALAAPARARGPSVPADAEVPPRTIDATEDAALRETERLLTEPPLETHVFLSLAHDMSLHVRTRSGVFLVEKGRIAHEASGAAPTPRPEAGSSSGSRAG